MRWPFRLLAGVERAVDRSRLVVKRRLGQLGPVTVQPFTGIGNGTRIRLKARVVEAQGLDAPATGKSAWANLVAMFHRFDSDEVPDARVRVSWQGRHQEFVADEEGYVDILLDAQEAAHENRPGPWEEVKLELLAPLGPRHRPPVTSIGRVLVVPPDAAFGVISDIDDTIIKTGATALLRNLRFIRLASAEGRSPFPGVAAFYRALQRGRGTFNPIFYVSSSPWNLYDLLQHFMRHHGIPEGPMLLRDLGLQDGRLSLGGGHQEHKVREIERLLAFYPRLRFILIGDSGQQDATIYREVVHRHPRRIMAVYIRDLTPEHLDHPARALLDEIRKAGAEAVFSQTMVEAAQNAAAQGWIAAEAVREVTAEVAEPGQDSS